MIFVMLISNFQPSECMSMVCGSCTQPLDESNPADVRCVNINCDQIKLCHCCGEKLTSKVSSIECYVCKEMHCLFCDKDSFRFDVRWKEKQICDHCYERNPHVDTDDLGFDYISEDEFIEIDHRVVQAEQMQQNMADMGNPMAMHTPSEMEEILLEDMEERGMSEDEIEAYIREEEDKYDEQMGTNIRDERRRKNAKLKRVVSKSRVEAKPTNKAHDADL